MQLRGSAFAFWHDMASFSSSSHQTRSRVTREPSTCIVSATHNPHPNAAF